MTASAAIAVHSTIAVLPSDSVICAAIHTAA
jgi:hypothetical protein